MPFWLGRKEAWRKAGAGQGRLSPLHVLYLSCGLVWLSGYGGQELSSHRAVWWGGSQGTMSGIRTARRPWRFFAWCPQGLPRGHQGQYRCREDIDRGRLHNGTRPVPPTRNTRRESGPKGVRRRGPWSLSSLQNIGSLCPLSGAPGVILGYQGLSPRYQKTDGLCIRSCEAA